MVANPFVCLAVSLVNCEEGTPCPISIHLCAYSGTVTGQVLQTCL